MKTVYRIAPRVEGVKIGDWPKVERVHFTAIRRGGVYGHSVKYCDESGCSGSERFFDGIDPDEINLEHGEYDLELIEIDDARVEP